MSKSDQSRRAILVSGLTALGGLAMPSILRAQAVPDYDSEPSIATTRRNVMGFRNHDWRDHFSNLRRGAILCDTDSRAVHFWSEDESTYLAYPTSVPMTEEFTRRGLTEVTLKRYQPTWVPTPNMRARDPSLPARVEGGDPKNPMGTRAMNLSWQYYRVHGIDDPAKVGRRASNGCFGLINAHVEALYELVEVGTQVRVI
ncbi:L,D-transpeptidase-like protein [Roseinatronobacter thiooxidans]|uniref:L,D-transpeptidase-like protein n=1 Tax=Roseinatronobacter thiooxidans TaxID=121821 RepID=A0A2W7QMX7_9RHOB|nr:L,D-transpeptidase [Roseinatronobacter thiooxidans]PZX47420.1 L,D-transpeptidase-like protein [Roseinatronobacter thiooxidans]